MAAQPPPGVVERVPPQLLGLRLGIGQRRPVRGAGLGFRPGIPWADSAVEVGGLARPVGLGGEVVDHRRVEGVLTLLRPLDVAILAAPFAKEVALRSLAVSASAAAAFGHQRRVLQESQLFQ